MRRTYDKNKPVGDKVTAITVQSVMCLDNQWCHMATVGLT